MVIFCSFCTFDSICARTETRACVSIGAHLAQSCNIHFLLSNAHSLDLLGPLQMSTNEFLPIFLVFKICPIVNSCLQQGRFSQNGYFLPFFHVFSSKNQKYDGYASKNDCLRKFYRFHSTLEHCRTLFIEKSIQKSPDSQNPALAQRRYNNIS